MTLKEYQKIRLVVIVAISLVFSQAIVYKNCLVPIAVLIAGSLVFMYLRRRVEGVMADERDYAVGGKAALLAMQTYSWLAVMAMFVFYGLRDINPFYEAIGMTLAFSTCLLMLTYAVIFRYYERISLTDKRLLYTIFVLVLFLGMFIASVRLFSGEDNWICENGQWVKHGNPSYPAPSVKCE